MLLVAMFAMINGSIAKQQDNHLPRGCERAITAKQSEPFIRTVWDKHLWERGSPGSKARKAWRHKLHCAGPPNRKAMKLKWRDAKMRYGRHRAFRLVAPYPGGGTYWAVPWPIVECESLTSGLWSAYNPSGAAGPYQLMAEHGRPWPVYNWHDKMEHHRIAGGLYAESGSSPWVSSESCWA